MKCVKSEYFSQLQKNPKNIRNICIMAHVDHGKTTLADSLIASNGVISKKLAGKLRYLDSREDEQQRGITMKSSAIALHHQKDNEDYLINLIDSPGHVDFSNEVSTAVRLCDGAIILIDVIEGVCPQTKVSLRQAWIEGIKPILVLNKIDRLITEKKLTPLDAFVHLQQTLEQVNAFVCELFASEIFGKINSEVESRTKVKENNNTSDTLYDWSSGLEDTDDSQVYFSPDQKNVIFACALDGWGFGIAQFAKIYSDKLGIREHVLMKTLWGDFYLNNKTKRIVKGAQAKAKKPLFVQFILENIWSVYEAVVERRDKQMIEKIISSLKLDVKPRDLRYNDPHILLQLIFSQWLPLSKSTLDMVCDLLPNPMEITEERCEKLMCAHLQRFESLPKETQELKKNFLACSSAEDVPVIVFISKMFTVEKSSLPRFKQKLLTLEEMKIRRERAQQMKMAAQQRLLEEDKDKGDNPDSIKTSKECSDIGSAEETVSQDEKEDDSNVFIAFARVFSGTLRKGQRVFVLGPKHNPASALEDASKGVSINDELTLKDLKFDQHVTTFEVNDLYLLMGRELELLTDVPAGNVVGIGNLQDHVLKSATLSTSLACPSFTDLHVHSPPIVRVALEPVHTADMPALIRGLKLLNQADAAVQVTVQETGEHVIVTAGEVHLQRCLDDLRKTFAKVEVVASKPIVPFRETIIEPPKIDMVNEIIEDKNQILKNNAVNKQTTKVGNKEEDPGLITLQTPNKKCTLKIRAIPLPNAVTDILEENVEILKAIDLLVTSSTTGNENLLKEDTITAIDHFHSKLNDALVDAGSQWNEAVDSIMSFGPRRRGANVLVCKVAGYCRPPIWTNDQKWRDSPSAKYEGNLISGFQLATLAGPLCEEPMRGVCFVLEGFDVDGDELQDDLSSGDPYGPFSGQLMSTMKEGCRRAFQAQPQRLLAAMYTCNILVRTEVLGKMYALLGKRNGRVMSSDLMEGTQVFNVTATLPVIESFDFASEIRKQTSGHAMPQLVFTHWEVVDVDPFWVPSTEEEYAHFGEKADSENRAKRYMNDVRRRKGLSVDEKIVEHAEKQRTLTRNK